MSAPISPVPGPTSPGPVAGAALGRRRLLARFGLAGLGLTGLTGIAAASGCSGPPPDPGSGANTPGSTPTTRSGSAGPSSSAPAPPLSGAGVAIETESRLCAVATGVLAKTGDEAPSGRQRTILTQIRDAHLDHLRALSSDPTQPSHPASPAAPRAIKAPTKLDDALDRLVELETAAAKQHRGRLAAAEPDAGLVWASLAAAATGYADALRSGRSRSSTPLGRTRQPAVELSPAQAMSALLAQVHAVLYGYQTAVPRLSGDAATTALDRITACYRLRDSLTARLVALKQTPPVAEPAYVVRPRPTDSANAGRLLAGMETRLQPFCGQWVDASSGDERTVAAGALTDSTRAALGWGAPLNRWPGWA